MPLECSLSQCFCIAQDFEHEAHEYIAFRAASCSGVVGLGPVRSSMNPQSFRISLAARVGRARKPSVVSCSTSNLQPLAVSRLTATSSEALNSQLNSIMFQLLLYNQTTGSACRAAHPS